MSRFDITRKQFVRLGLGIGGSAVLGCGGSSSRGGAGGAGGDEDTTTGAGGSGSGAGGAGGSGPAGSGVAGSGGGAAGAGGSRTADAAEGSSGADAGAGVDGAAKDAGRDGATVAGKDLVIDSHMHVWSDDLVAFPYAHPFDKAYVPGIAPGNVETLVQEMDQLGVDNCVLIQAIQHGWDNRYIASCLKKYPKRFRAHGLMDPTLTGLAATLEMWMTQYGLSGMRINPVYYVGKEQWIDSAEHKLLWKKAEQLGAVFNYFITPPQLARLETMIKLFPGVQIVIDHEARVNIALPDPMPDFKKLLALAAYPNVSVKVSELANLSPSHLYPFAETYPWILRMMDAFGPDRLLWGTGFPGAAARAEVMWATGPQELDLIRTKIGFKPEDVPKILGRNAARIWKFPIT